jgi:lipopolysaccharide export system permease protein
MKLIDRYLLLSLIQPLLFCLLAFYSLFIVIDLFDTLPDIIKKQAGFGSLVQFYIIPAPVIFQEIIPAAYYLSVISVLLAWSSSRELTSVQSAGTGLARLSIPFFLVSLLIMGVQYGLFYRLSPQSGAMRQALEDKLENRPGVSDLFRGVVYKNPTTGALWFAQEIDLAAQTVKQAEILVPDDMGRDRVKYFAARGEYKNGFWDLAGVRKVEFNRDGSSLPPQDMAQMDATLLNESPQQLVAVMRPSSGMSWPELMEFMRLAHLGGAKMAPYQTEHYSRLAYPFLCPVLCCFAFGLAISNDRRSKATTVFQCLMVLVFLILFLEFFKALGSGKRLSPVLAAWSPIVIFGAAGLYLFSEKVGWIWNLRHFIRQGQSSSG